MKKIILIALFLSLGANMLQYLNHKEELRKAEELAEFKDDKGVRVRSFRRSVLIENLEALTLRDIEWDFCKEYPYPKVTVYPRVNLSRREEGQAYEFYEWEKPLPDAFNRKLVAGDEIYIQNEDPELDPNCDLARIVNLHKMQGKFEEGFVGVGPVDFGGNVVFSDRRIYRSDHTSATEEVIKFTEDEKTKFLGILNELKKKSGSPDSSIVELYEAKEPFAFHQWDWKAGSLRYRVQSYNNTHSFLVSKGSSFVYHERIHD